jgi:hypothetical protein
MGRNRYKASRGDTVSKEINCTFVRINVEAMFGKDRKDSVSVLAENKDVVKVDENERKSTKRESIRH